MERLQVFTSGDFYTEIAPAESLTSNDRVCLFCDHDRERVSEKLLFIRVAEFSKGATKRDDALKIVNEDVLFVFLFTECSDFSIDERINGCETLETIFGRIE